MFWDNKAGEEEIAGYVKLCYTTLQVKHDMVWIMLILFCIGILWVGMAIYIRETVLKPFIRMRDMPYELAKGHLQADLQESKGKFFGKFIWGLTMLRDALQEAKTKNLKLEKEKKMLLLSLSHDIKVPLSTSKLYIKALQEGAYETQEEKMHAYQQLNKHTLEIEEFVKAIKEASSEDILSLSVKDGEFYIQDFIDKIRTTYEPKCKLRMLSFQIAPYEKRLLRGDMERAVEAMENLLENAMKYGDGRELVIDFYEEDYCQIVRVFSSGNPIAAEEMPHLFDSFFRGGNAQGKEGNGLGLYICKQLMNKMEGEIFAERQEDGMYFCLVFKLA